MYTPQVYRPISRKRMNSVLERRVVNGVGLGEVDGLFNIGKMFTRMFTFTPSSFKIKNIAGAIGSAVTTVGTFGIANVASELAGRSGLGLTNTTLTSAHSDVMKMVGYTAVAAAAVAGAVVAAPLVGGALGIGGTAATGTGLTAAVGTEAAGSSIIGAATGQVAATGGGFFSAIGSGLSAVGSGLMTAIQALPLIGQVLGGGGGQPQQQQDFGPQQPTADQIAAQQAYDAQQAAYIQQQQAAMYQPGGYNPNIPYMTSQYAGPVSSSAGGDTYGDLRSPYTAIAEDGSTVQIDPATGQPIVASVLSSSMLIGGGVAVLLLGMYMMQGDDKK